MPSPIFLDTIDPQEVIWCMAYGLLGGVTTNPVLFQKMSKAERDQRGRYLAEIIQPRPLSLEVPTDIPTEIIDHAAAISKMGANVLVKIPVHGAKGELTNLAAIQTVAVTNKLPVNATAIMSPMQGLAAALAGASYVSLFAGRVANMGYDATREISKLRALLDAHAPQTKIIAASSREAYNITEWLLAGADIVTVTPEILKAALVHPYTKETVRQFLEAAE